jgi:uncharacterized protein YjbI with pentapeptide repeats
MATPETRPAIELLHIDMNAVTANETSSISARELAEILQGHERHLARARGDRRAVLPSCNLYGADFANRSLSEADLSGSTLDGARLTAQQLAEAIRA